MNVDGERRKSREAEFDGGPLFCDWWTGQLRSVLLDVNMYVEFQKLESVGTSVHWLYCFYSWGLDF
jgi:hypothetical protein